MATQFIHPMNRVVRHLRRAVLLRDQDMISDGRLLESFLARRDEAAFEILVKRHGPMVLGVCKRLIGNVHDAEDAFQAVFLVLARKAGSIRGALVGNWLYGVAYRTALQARALRLRRRRRETQVKDMPQPTVSPDLDLRELHQTLDFEISKLPDKFRVPIVLCDLEGRSRKDAAGQLRIAEGTLSSRLATGRKRLARRLARHGVTLPAAALATVLTHQAASGAVPYSLVSATVKAAALQAASEAAAGLISTQAFILSQGVMKTMLLNKLKVMGAVFLSVVLGGAGVGLGVFGATSAEAVQPSPRPDSKQTPPQHTREPFDARLLLDPKIQEELRLSKNQIRRLEAVSREVDRRNRARHAEIDRLQKQLEGLERQGIELHGRLWPSKRAWLYAPLAGTIKEFKENLVSGSKVTLDEELVRMFDMELADKINDLRSKIARAEITILAWKKSGLPKKDVAEAKVIKEAYSLELLELQRRANANLNKPGELWLRAPQTGIVLTVDFRDTLLNRHVKPSEPLLLIADADVKKPKIEEWELELKIPPKHIGQILKAIGPAPEALDADLLPSGHGKHAFRGKLARSRIAAELISDRDGSMSVTLAWVRLHGPDIPKDKLLSRELLLAGAEIRVFLRLGAAGTERLEIPEIRKRIDELQQRIDRLRGSIEKERSEALERVAPEILSSRAMERLRQIQRQKRGLSALLQDPGVQRMLKLDDEQLKTMEGIWDSGDIQFFPPAQALIIRSEPKVALHLTESDRNAAVRIRAVHALSRIHLRSLDSTQRLFQILSETQKRILLDWVGEPYQSSSWQALWDGTRR